MRPRELGPPPSGGSPPKGLRGLLDGLYARHHRPENLYPDPLVFARRYVDAGDGEVAGVVAAGLAYGQVDQIMLALEVVFRVLGSSPAAFVGSARPKDLAAAFSGFSYRFHKARDVALLLHLLAQVLARYGTLLECFRREDPGGPIGPALSAFAEALLAGDARPLLRGRAVPPGHPVRHFLPSPAKGGAAKRMCLFLRWMVRRDALDPGFWQGAVDPARLVVPLDTHVARVGRQLGLTARKATDWKTACEITNGLRRYDPADPVRYDFSLFRYGMGRSR